MAITPKDILSLSYARANLTELCEEVHAKGGEKLITKNGVRFAALIDAERLGHYHRLEREHIHTVMLQEAIKGVGDLKTKKTLSLAHLKSRHGQ